MPRFVRKHKVNFLLLADAEHEVAVVVHRRGNVKVDGHAEAVPAAVDLL